MNFKQIEIMKTIFGEIRNFLARRFSFRFYGFKLEIFYLLLIQKRIETNFLIIY